MAAYWAAKRRLFNWPGLRAAVVHVGDAQGALLAQELKAHALDFTNLLAVPLEQGLAQHADALRNGLDPLAFIRYLGSLGSVHACHTFTDEVPPLEALDAEGRHGARLGLGPGGGLALRRWRRRAGRGCGGGGGGGSGHGWGADAGGQGRPGVWKSTGRRRRTVYRAAPARPPRPRQRLPPVPGVLRG